MARPKSITNEQISLLVSLYKEGTSIKEIMTRTGIKSEQTIYRLLDDNKVSRRPKKRCPLAMTISFEEDVVEDIQTHEGNVSAFICECIRKARGR